MPAERKWVYWHRILSVPEGCKDLKVGDLLGPNHKCKECFGLVWNEERHTFDLGGLAKLKFIDRLLRTASPEEIVKKIGPVKIIIQPNITCNLRKCPRGGTSYCTFKEMSDYSRRLLCDANFNNGHCPKRLKPIRE